jgi:hypothetical protein
LIMQGRSAKCRRHTLWTAQACSTFCTHVRTTHHARTHALPPVQKPSTRSAAARQHLAYHYTLQQPASQPPGSSSSSSSSSSQPASQRPTSVQQLRHAGLLRHGGGAAPHAAVVVVGVRQQRGRQPAPVSHVLAHEVAPEWRGCGGRGRGQRPAVVASGREVAGAAGVPWWLSKMQMSGPPSHLAT